MIKEEELRKTENYKGEKTDRLTQIRQIMLESEFWSSANIEGIENTICFDTTNAWSKIVGYIFKSYQNLEKFSRECEQLPKGVCAGNIVVGEQHYKCFDCGKNAQSSIYCAKCFESGLLEGKHKNHRYKTFTYQYGLCDCGDINQIRKQGFCSSHSGHNQCDKRLEDVLFQRLEEILVRCFQILFNYCDESMTHNKLLFPSSRKISKFSITQINSCIRNIFETLNKLVSDFCEYLLPLKFAISQIMMKPLNRKLLHICNKNQFFDTFNQNMEHLCPNTICELIFKYAYATDFIEQKTTKFLYSLFVNSTFKSYLGKIFLDFIPFIVIVYKDSQQISVSVVLNSYSLFYQFYRGQSTNSFILYPGFTNIQEKFKLIIELLNKNYLKSWNYFDKIIEIFQRILLAFANEKNECLTLKILCDLLEMASYADGQEGYSFKHHKIKIQLVSHLLKLFEKYVSSIKYQDEKSISIMKDCIKTYFYQYQNQYVHSKKMRQKQVSDKIEQKVSSQINKSFEERKIKGNIKLDWYRLKQLEVGVLISSIYFHFGRQELKNLLSLESTNGGLNVWMRSIIQAQMNAYKISESKQVGFPDELSLKQLYRYYYKHPAGCIEDCSISILQIMASVFPQIFVQEVNRLENKYIIKLLSDVFLEQTSFINFSFMCQFKTNYSVNSLKIMMINILNLKNKSTISELNKLYLLEMFLQNIQFDQVLSEISTYDFKSQCYTIKQKYKNLQEGIYVRRAEDTFSNLFETQTNYFTLIEKGNLIQKQIQQKWKTLCSEATKEVTLTTLFMQLFQKMLGYIWTSSQSIDNYKAVELIYTILIRNNSSEFKEIVSKLDINIETLPQKLLKQILNKVTLGKIKLDQKPLKVQNKNRMKAQIEKMKKQQKLFIQNNNQIFVEASETMIEQKSSDEDICIICHQKKEGNNYLFFPIFISNESIQNQIKYVYMSCGHYFHKNCIQKMNKRCPLCQTFWNEIISMIPDSSYTMLNPNQNNTIQLLKNEKQIEFSKKTNIEKHIQMISTKIYLSVLGSCEKYYKRQIKQLRSLYLQCLYSKDKPNGLSNDKFINYFPFKFIEKDKRDVFKMLQLFFNLPFTMKSLQVSKKFSQIISVWYSSIFANNLICFLDPNNSDIQSQIKLHQHNINARLNEFCKLVIFSYALLFDDKRNQILQQIKDEDSVGQIFTKTYPEIFVLNKDILHSSLNAYKNDENSRNYIQENLVPIPNTIFLPENYMEFHKNYYDLKCDDCKGIIQVNKKNAIWMCLLCGYKSCLRNCSSSNFSHNYAMYIHFQDFHHHKGPAIEMNSSQVNIFYGDTRYQYGHFYLDAFQRSDNQNILNWTELKLNNNILNKLKDIMRNFSLPQYIDQSLLKYKTLQEQT